MVCPISCNKGAELTPAQSELAEDKEISSPMRVITGDEAGVANGKSGFLLLFLGRGCHAPGLLSGSLGPLS